MRDSDLRSKVVEELRLKYGRDPDTSIVHEMGVWSGSVRIDIAVINGELVGFELKSDRDTLERLPVQADLYNKVFNRITLIVGKFHVGNVKSIIPNWWGIQVASSTHKGIILSDEREPKSNPKRDPYLTAQLLWKDEALDVLASHDMDRGYRSKRVKCIHEKLSESLPLEVLSEHVREKLKIRKNWLRQEMPN